MPAVVQAMALKPGAETGTAATRGSSVIGTTAGDGQWENTANMYDGTVGQNSNYAQWILADLANCVGTIEVAYPWGTFGLVGNETITGASAKIRQYSSGSALGSITLTLENSAGAAIGSARPVTVVGSATTETITFTTLPTMAQIMNGLRTKATGTHANSSETLSWYIDFVDVYIDWSRA